MISARASSLNARRRHATSAGSWNLWHRTLVSGQGGRPCTGSGIGGKAFIARKPVDIGTSLNRRLRRTSFRGIVDVPVRSARSEIAVNLARCKYGRQGPGMTLVYKIFRAEEFEAFQAAGRTAGSPDDVRDGFVHFSTGAQVEETASRHFAGEAGLMLVCVDAGSLEDFLKWEPSRDGALFPHLYRDLRIEDVKFARALPLSDGRHMFEGRLG